MRKLPQSWIRTLIPILLLRSLVVCRPAGVPADLIPHAAAAGTNGRSTPQDAPLIPSAAFVDRPAELGLEMANSAACWADVDNEGGVDLCVGGEYGRFLSGDCCETPLT